MTKALERRTRSGEIAAASLVHCVIEFWEWRRHTHASVRSRNLNQVGISGEAAILRSESLVTEGKKIVKMTTETNTNTCA